MRRDNGAKSLRLRTINGTAVITPDQLEKFKLYSEYSAAAYCGAQQGEAGSRITCGTAGVCPKVERHNTRIYKTWAEYVTNFRIVPLATCTETLQGGIAWRNGLRFV